MDVQGGNSLPCPPMLKALDNWILWILTRLSTTTMMLNLIILVGSTNDGGDHCLGLVLISFLGLLLLSVLVTVQAVFGDDALKKQEQNMFKRSVVGFDKVLMF